MSKYKTLQHAEWECKYHVIFSPKYRRKVLYGEIRQYLGEVFRRLARQKESEIEEGHLLPDHRAVVTIWVRRSQLCGSPAQEPETCQRRRLRSTRR
jgi:REP element-mobilizing transposase RayT